MKYVELLNSIAMSVIRIYKYQIIRYYCDKCNNIASLVCQDCEVYTHVWVCDNCGGDIGDMVSIETRLEEIKEDIEKRIQDKDYFEEIDENNNGIKIALAIINFVNNYKKEN